MYELTTLNNGLRVMTVSLPHTQSVSVGLFLRVGSRWESPACAGASHFIEHMAFKGTTRRPTARDIAEAIEGRGGMFNASTGVETTLYWAKVAAVHLPEAMDALSDMLLHPLFRPQEMEKERAIITEEIKYDLDAADSLVQMLVTELQWPGHPLGRDVMGTLESVAALDRETLLEYRNRHYVPGAALVGVAGRVNHRDVVALARVYLAEWAARPVPTCLPAQSNGYGPRLRVAFRDTEQAHLNLSFAGIARGHPDRFALHLLNVILGEGMRSRLFQEVRERMGLAYSVDSYVNLLQDTGSFGIYAGVAIESVDDTLRAILGQLDRLRQEPVSEAELQRAKEFAKGRTALALEDPFALLSWYARQELLGPEVLSPEQVMAQLEQVRPPAIQRLAQALFQEEYLNLAVVGPFQDDGHWRQAVALR